MTSASRVILLACGCFNPVTNMHLRLFELSRDHMQLERNFRVVRGIMSPTNDYYEKKGLIAAEHRLAMTRLAVSTSGWLEVDQWEIDQPEWTETVKVMRHVHEQADQGCQVKLLCGADLLESFAVPDLWTENDIEEIVGRFGMVVITRSGSNPDDFIAKSPQLTRLKSNIEIVEEPISNEVSATSVRNSIKKGWSVKYLTPDPVIEYIKEHNLYKQ